MAKKKFGKRFQVSPGLWRRPSWILGQKSHFAIFDPQISFFSDGPTITFLKSIKMPLFWAITELSIFDGARDNYVYVCARVIFPNFLGRFGPVARKVVKNRQICEIVTAVKFLFRTTLQNTPKLYFRPFPWKTHFLGIFGPKTTF